MKFIKSILVLFLTLITSIGSAQLQFEAKPNHEDLKDKVFIITELAKTDFSTSDSIVVKYKLYVSHDTGIENWKETYLPEYIGFDANNLKSDNIKVVTETYNGETYRTVTFKEVILKPTQKGTLELPEYSLNVQASIPSKKDKKSYDDFGRPVLDKKDFTIKTDKISLTVK